MRGRPALLVCVILIYFSNSAFSRQFDGRSALRIVGGSSEEPSVDENRGGSPQPTPTELLTEKTEPKGAKVSQDNQGIALKKKRRPKLNLGIGSSALEKLKNQSSNLAAAVGPAVVAFVQLFSSSDGTGLVTKPAVYALALLGSSSGFHLFLYFITVGFSCGVTLPVLVAMIVYNFKCNVPYLTNVYCSLLVLWGIRSTCFFLYREYINWPQLHEKVIEVNKLARPLSKLFCWLMYSLFYVTLTTPFLCRLEGACTGSCRWNRFGMIAISLQTLGLLLETVADQQKMAFKSRPGNRNVWCHTGLWKYSTHPNYAGEQLFWLGSFLGGLSCYRTRTNLGMAIFGLVFISVVLSGARVSLGSKHLRKYGSDVDFLEFRKTHSMWGPIPWRKPQDRQLVL